MSVYKKLSEARVEFHSRELKKSGENKFAGYKYFELADFIKPAIDIFHKHGLCAFVSFNAEATITIVDVENPADRIVISSPLAEAQLKGCHPVQNLGASQTYLRRYLWVAALEIIEHDAVDSSTGSKEGSENKEGADNQSKENNLINQSQVDFIRAECESLKVNPDQFCKFLGVQSLEHIKAARYKDAVAALAKKKAAMIVPNQGD